jgi:hypothetical protein
VAESSKEFNDFLSIMEIYSLFPIYFLSPLHYLSPSSKGVAESSKELNDLLSIMKIFYSGTEKERAIISDFLSTLKAYDTRGQATSEALRIFVINQPEQDDFARFILSHY